jgi:hypothetical protein
LNGVPLEAGRQQPAERGIVPVARPQDDWDDPALSGVVPFKRADHFLLVAVIGGEKVRAHEQKHNIAALKVRADGVSECLASRDPPVVPGLDETLALEHRKMRFELIAKRFVPMTV